MTVYYAHPVALYGTAQEARDIATLEALGLTVLNPNSPEGDAGYEESGMEFFYEMIEERAQALAFRALPDGSIPAGVAGEIDCASGMALPIIELPAAVLRRTLSVEETREQLRDSGKR